METTFESVYHTVPASRTRARVGAAVSALPVLFLLFDGVVKLLRIDPVMEGMARLGYPAGTIIAIGLLEALCLVLYVIPRTSILGAILFTGYLGGAVASHVRVGDPLWSHVLFPVYVAALLWGGLYLRDARLRGLIPAKGH